MIRAIIVDDEPLCCDTLETMLEKYCPEVELAAICHSGEEAIAAINQQKPDLVFLDIEMPRMNGFDMLQKISAINFEIIFTTSFDQYALRAIRFSALDYLLKPIDKEDLQTAVQKVIQRTQKTHYTTITITDAETAATNKPDQQNCFTHHGRLANGTGGIYSLL